MTTLQLLLAALVLLPLLPDRGTGPWVAVNPRSVGLLTPLIAGLSVAGYGAVRWLGSERGTLVTALLGGLTSSTAVTVAFLGTSSKPFSPRMKRWRGRPLSAAASRSTVSFMT